MAITYRQARKYLQPGDVVYTTNGKHIVPAQILRIGGGISGHRCGCSVLRGPRHPVVADRKGSKGEHAWNMKSCV